MRKLKTLLVLSGLVVSVLAGCNTKTNSSSSTPKSSDPISEPSSAPTSAPTSAPSSESSSSSSQVVKTLQSIRIAAEPTKKNYFVGDAFDAAGLQVKAIYNTGEEDLASGYELSGFDSTTAGEKTITVTYMAKTATFKVNVEAVVLTGIEIAAEPTKKTYYAGDAFDAAGLQVKAVFNNGKKEDLAADAYELSGFDTNVSGAQTITVTYQEKTATFAVTVIGKDGIAVTAPKKVRYAVGDEFDATGLVVAQRFADGTQVPLAEGAYTLAGFDSETVGEKTITVTVGADTAEFKVNVYKADWTAAEKAAWTGTNANLEFELPYFLSFELSVGGIPNEADPTKTDVEWFEARTDFKVKRSELNAYADSIEDIKVPALDDNDQPMTDENGDPLYRRAWLDYQTTNGKDLTDDVELLGFAEDSDILQYARWSHDDTNYFEFQILTIGLDEDGKLLAVTTFCNFPLFGWGKFGQRLMVNQKSGTVMDGLCGLAADYAAYIQFNSPSPAEDAPYFQHGIVYPEFNAFDEDAFCVYFNNAIDKPYLLANEYSELYNIADFSLVFGTGKKGADGKETPFLPAQLDAIMAKYTEKGIDHTTETINGIDVYKVELEDEGFVIDIEYYIINGYIRMDVDIVSYTRPASPTPTTPLALIYDVVSASYDYKLTGEQLAGYGFVTKVSDTVYKGESVTYWTSNFTGQLVMLLSYYIEESNKFPSYLSYVTGGEPKETDGVGVALTQVPDGSLYCQVTAKYDTDGTHIYFLVAPASYFNA